MPELIDRDSIYSKVVDLYRHANPSDQGFYLNVLNLILDEPVAGKKSEIQEVETPEILRCKYYREYELAPTFCVKKWSTCDCGGDVGLCDTISLRDLCHEE